MASFSGQTPLAESDPTLFALLGFFLLLFPSFLPSVFTNYVEEGEKKRQAEGISLIASENFASLAVLEATSSMLTNKYAGSRFPHRSL